ncbi:hypothetical protein NLX83_11950 [Allokutzneria sp. A3M-2-11 16]|uniref:hypothetical protein n=1 Tax=Allokutzneria sp. A3M-2-11 16 TaxID=2962043 RepID=UPI0020B70164|nr:hypothetical protein [Allokutzneria sp. A3M-2-11 16]MCP3799969.1 hypothetical protein [Allokutzneria sp. A3M-2-11 16]
MFWSVKESQWSIDHIARHGVTLDEVREVVLERPHWMTSGREDSTLIYGRTCLGRYLLVVAVGDRGEAFVVTAREMTASEKKTFRRKAR